MVVEMVVEMLTDIRNQNNIGPMPSGKTKVRKRSKKPRLATSDKINSQTTEIPVRALFGDTNLQNSARIEVTCPGKRLFIAPIGAEEVVIGRNKYCGICLPITNVSRIHARIITKGEEIVIEDLDSTNGTFVNNIRIINCVLHDNDQIRVGEARMVFFRQKMRVR